MSPVATLKAETAVAVHVLGIDPDLRVLLDQGPLGPEAGGRCRPVCWRRVRTRTAWLSCW